MRVSSSSLLVLALASPLSSAFQQHSPVTQKQHFNLQHRINFKRFASSINASGVGRTASPLENFWNNLFGKKQKDSAATFEPSLSATGAAEDVVKNFVKSLNERDVSSTLPLLSDSILYDDYAFGKPFDGFPQPIKGLQEVQNQLRLQLDAIKPAQILVIDDTAAVADSKNNDLVKVGIKYHSEDNGSTVINSRGVAYFELISEENEWKISQMDWVKEAAKKEGESKLKLLSAVSPLFSSLDSSSKKSREETESDPPTGTTEYFKAWNRRDMTVAVDCFTDDVTYDDTAFPEPFSGKEKLDRHLRICADCFPDSFTFDTDATIIGESNNAMVKWHVANNGNPLPYSRGISFYTFDGPANKQGSKIRDGLDFVEPSGPIKAAPLNLWKDSLQLKLANEPARIIPLVLCVAYYYIVFFSDGILPGANALELEARTWEEVRDLSLNFFLVSPILNLPFAPTLNPVLEGMFNILLSWAAMFAGFLSDDRSSSEKAIGDKPNLFPMFPTVVGMQFLTSAFLLPYLTTRSTETRTDVKFEELSKVTQVCESKAFGISLAFVGSYSLAWAFFARYDTFGDLSQRWASFIDLLSIDRVGSSFVVDLVIFGLFQGWFVDEDLKRRGVSSGEQSALRFVGKFIPFFGMAAYLTFRPSFPSKEADRQI